MIPLQVEKLLLLFSSSNIKSMLYIYMRLMKESQTIAHCWALKINNGMEAIWTLRAGMIDKQQLATWRTTYMWTLPHIQIVFIHIYTQYTNCTFIALYHCTHFMLIFCLDFIKRLKWSKSTVCIARSDTLPRHSNKDQTTTNTTIIGDACC